jgi:hypothetical protein
MLALRCLLTFNHLEQRLVLRQLKDRDEIGRETI